MVEGLVQHVGALGEASGQFGVAGVTTDNLKVIEHRSLTR